jgi:uncharacterized protein (DUF2252 family)
MPSKPAVLVFHPRHRQSVLSQRRTLKMARSAHAYVRGSTVQFYRWLNSSRAKRVPHGPPIWICGDCHLGNLGPVADAKGRVRIAIRDLDQTVIGNPAHDLIRLALSLATAIRGSDLPGVTTAMVLEQMALGYVEALSPAGKSTPSGKVPRAVSQILDRSYRRRWHHLAEERIEDVTPKIPYGKSFWPITSAERKEIYRIFKDSEVRGLITSLKGRKDGDRVEVLDAAYWVKGCSSLGRLRFSVLVGIGKKKKRKKEDGFCLIDIKEATPPAAPRLRAAKLPTDNAQRVVEGARMLSPFLGQRMIPGRFLNHEVVLRELLPQDLKLEMDQLTRDEAILAARYLAFVVGSAHASQMDDRSRRKWRKTLLQDFSTNLDAPSWLWASVVDLVAHHETAYLEHCRRYALEFTSK